MKILHVLYESEGDYFGIGGVGMRAYEIYNHLKERHEITLLCRKYKGATNGKIKDIEHIFAGIETKNFTITLLSYAFSAFEFVRKFGQHYDVIIEEFSPAVPAFLHLYKKKPVVLQIQGYTGKKYLGKYNSLYSWALYILEIIRPYFYRNFVYVSKETNERFRTQNSSNITIIPNGISEELLFQKPKESSDYILYLSRIDVHHKGLDILLEGYRIFHKSCPHIRLVIAGDGRNREEFDLLVKSLPREVKESIELTGWVKGEAKLKLLRDALFFVQPSRYESQPITVLEALACGKSIIGSNINELKFISEKGFGYNFRSEDSKSLADTMTKLLKDERRLEMGLKGREWMSSFTWEKAAIEFENFLKSLVN